MTPTPEEIDEMWDGKPKLTATVPFRDYIIQKISENPEKWARAVEKYRKDSTDNGDLKNLIDSATQDYRNMQRDKEKASGIKKYHFDVHHEGFVKHGGEWFIDKIKDLVEGTTDIPSYITADIKEQFDKAKEVKKELEEEEERKERVITPERPIREMVEAQTRYIRVNIRYEPREVRLIKNRVERNNTYRGKRETWQQFGIRTDMILYHSSGGLSNKASRMRKVKNT